MGQHLVDGVDDIDCVDDMYQVVVGLVVVNSAY